GVKNANAVRTGLEHRYRAAIVEHLRCGRYVAVAERVGPNASDNRKIMREPAQRCIDAHDAGTGSSCLERDLAGFGRNANAWHYFAGQLCPGCGRHRQLFCCYRCGGGITAAGQLRSNSSREANTKKQSLVHSNLLVTRGVCIVFARRSERELRDVREIPLDAIER